MMCRFEVAFEFEHAIGRDHVFEPDSGSVFVFVSGLGVVQRHRGGNWEPEYAVVVAVVNELELGSR